ncbi:MAG: methyltransferase domain-containing protein [Deltaproteobacteria bacterium]|nr:MAG: methyltransferase domain-containing protein [Deltaproteobacteria bacterium]
MGLIFDINAARLYEFWCHSPQGRAMERSAEKLILTLLNPQPGERVLDIGCGAGNHLLFFNKLGLDITGLDASPYMISMARERLGNRCSLNRGMAGDLPFDDNEFDLAVLINTLEFLDDPLQALREAGRVASRRVFIGTMNSLSWHCLCTKLLSVFRDSLFNHVKFYNIWELKSYVQLAYGHVPMEWRCTQVWPSSIGKIGVFKSDLWNLKHCPFGSFLGLSARILHWVKTDNLPLKIRMKKARQSIASGLTMKNVNRVEDSPGDERGLSI